MYKKTGRTTRLPDYNNKFQQKVPKLMASWPGWPWQQGTVSQQKPTTTTKTTWY